MQVKLIREWVKAGSPPLEDLGAVLNIGYVELIKFMNGSRYPDSGTKGLIAEVFGKKPGDLFD